MVVATGASDGHTMWCHIKENRDFDFEFEFGTMTTDNRILNPRVCTWIPTW